MSQIKDKVVLITGASSGTGEATARLRNGCPKCLAFVNGRPRTQCPFQTAFEAATFALCDFQGLTPAQRTDV